MFSKAFLAVLTLALTVPEQALGRERWLERDGKAILLHPRRFGQENPAIIQKLSGLCDGAVCGNLAGAAISTLLAASPACAQQDHADKIIDAAQQFDATTKAAMIAAAVEFRKAEKNTPPDFAQNPPTPRNSVFCDKAPKNRELDGLTQAQDPANGDVFFDPETKKSVLRGEQPNTFPFGTPQNNNGAAAAPAPNTAAAATATATKASETGTAATACAPDVTVTVTAAAAAETAAPPATNNAAAIGDFGSCTVPQIEFGVGFDNRKESSFRPVDRQSFDHGSAQAIGIITQFVCDTLTNKCKADQTAKDTCKRAQAAAAAQPPKTGADADAFNAVFGIQTNFKNVQAIDDQGRAVGAAPAGNAAISAPAPATNGAATAGAIGDFGSCTVPQIEFGVGFDGRKESAFRPVDLQSFNHGSAQAIGIITQFVCDTLTNKCKADQTAKDTCKRAQAAAAAQPPKTGADADAFNAVFGIQTNFKNVQAIDDQGRVVGAVGAAAPPPAANTVTAAAPAANTATPPAAAAGNAAGGIGNFGKCSVPQIEFGAGFDNRRETAFRPVDRVSFPHDSAQNGGIITQFVCDTLTNTCGADQTAKDTCQKARAAFDAATPAKTGAQADAFNAVFGKATNFKAVAVIDNQGNVVA